MSENLKTIRELADELGVSKTAINKKVSATERKLWFLKIGNKFVINESGQKSIKSMFSDVIANQEKQTESRERKSYSQTESKTENPSNVSFQYVLDIIEYQKEQIKDLKDTKTEQFNQISQMQNLLNQQQRLALQDKKLLEEYKAEIKELKSLTMPARDSGQEDTLKSDDESENITEETHKENKKWWHFGK